MKRHVPFILAFLFAVGAGVAFRLPKLALRPMHCDEGINAVKFRDLYEHGTYRYDPTQFHGPTIYYLALPFAWLSHAGNWLDIGPVPYRLVAVSTGMGLILVLLLLRDGLGAATCVAAALLMAISPAMVFYSRYFIHEVPLVLFATGAIGCAWRWWRGGKLAWAIAVGVCIGLTHATKETCFLFFAAMAIAAGISVAWGRWVHGEAVRPRSWLRKRDATIALLTAAVTSALFYSAFFTHTRGMLDALRMYESYVKRAGTGAATVHESPHLQPAGYYLHLLGWWRNAGTRQVWSELLILALAAVGAVATLAGAATDRALLQLRRFFVFYTLILLTAFSTIPYKTPWNALGFWAGAIVVAGIGAATILRALPLAGAIVAALLLAAGAGQLARQCYRLNFVYDADPRNPYVYAHTTHKAEAMVQRVEQLADYAPAGHKMVIAVATENYWPLPWYLRRFDRVGWWDHSPTDAGPVLNAASVILVSTDMADEVERQLSNPAAFKVMIYSLRPDVLMEMYVRRDLWNAYMAERGKARGATTGRKE